MPDAEVTLTTHRPQLPEPDLAFSVDFKKGKVSASRVFLATHEFIRACELLQWVEDDARRTPDPPARGFLAEHQPPLGGHIAHMVPWPSQMPISLPRNIRHVRCRGHLHPGGNRRDQPPRPPMTNSLHIGDSRPTANTRLRSDRVNPFVTANDSGAPSVPTPRFLYSGPAR